MIHPFTVSDSTEITPQLACCLARLHKSRTHARYDKLEKYYEDEHDILFREKRSVLANNKLVCNHASYITNTAVGYFAGNPVKYSGDNIEPLTDLLRYADSAVQDTDLALKASIYGVAYEFIYLDRNGKPKLCAPHPKQAFVIYDDTVEQRPRAGVYYYELRDSVTGEHKGYSFYLCDERSFLRFTANTSFVVDSRVEETPHVLGGVPFIEIYNNSVCKGDFEPVISLIDAYNILQSDRLNDKEQFVEAILLIKGFTLGDDNAERSETYKAIRDNGLLEVDADGSAQWLTRQFDENSVEVLRRSVEQDIHKFANVPCMTDSSFGGNVSGVAIRYKLLGFETITKIKERYFREGINERLRLFCNYLSLTGGGNIDSTQVNVQFTRALPVNELEKAELVAALRDSVPLETLLAQLPFIDDPVAAAEQMKSEANSFPNLPTEMNDDE